MARINDFLGSMREVYIDWSAYLVNPRYIRNGLEVTWANRISGIRKEIIRESHVAEMSNTGQYSFQVLKDGSLIQLYYRFNRTGKHLVSASLSYFRAEAEKHSSHDEIFIDELEILPADGVLRSESSETAFRRAESDYPIGWFRIDYAPEAQERGVIHHDGHMHLSSFPNTRLMVNGIPSPAQFIEFVFASCYPDEYKMHRLNLESKDAGKKVWVHRNPDSLKKVNRLCHQLPEDPVYLVLPHVHIPVAIRG